MKDEAKIKELTETIEEQKKTIKYLREVIIKAMKICEQIKKVMDR